MIPAAARRQISHSPLLLLDPPGRIELSGRGQTVVSGEHGVTRKGAQLAPLFLLSPQSIYRRFSFSFSCGSLEAAEPESLLERPFHCTRRSRRPTGAAAPFTPCPFTQLSPSPNTRPTLAHNAGRYRCHPAWTVAEQTSKSNHGLPRAKWDSPPRQKCSIEASPAPPLKGCVHQRLCDQHPILTRRPLLMRRSTIAIPVASLSP